jgi:formylmethanofuran dehydrogenase subunit E
MLGIRELGLDPVAERKRIVTYVEIDRCVTDAVALVANCRLGKRALKFRDWGKVAATFCDLQTGRAIRIAAKESSKQAAKELFPDSPREEAQQKAYAQLADEVLFSKEWVKVEVPPEDLPGFKGPRVVCAECGEGINFKRQVVIGNRILCHSCAGDDPYYEKLERLPINSENRRFRAKGPARRIYEVWIDADGWGTTRCAQSDVRDYLERGVIEKGAVFQHRIEADTPEEAAAISHLRLGREPFHPFSQLIKCPNGCGAYYSPEESGECPNCGRIR